MNILFVCLGNICRSPMAAGIMRDIYKKGSLPGTIESAGTADWNAGQAAASLAVAVAFEHGLDISAHRARQVVIDDFSRFDRIYVMDRANERALMQMAPADDRHKISLLRIDAEVDDPYGGDRATYRQAFNTIERACLCVARSLQV